MMFRLFRNVRGLRIRQKEVLNLSYNPIAQTFAQSSGVGHCIVG